MTEEDARPGLRERKNARTREAIERAALELALEQGFGATTVDQIAERADVAPRTIYARYETKEAIVFGDKQKGIRFRELIGGNDGDIVERLTAYVRESVEASQAEDRTAGTQAQSGLKRLRLRAMLTDPCLRGTLRTKLDLGEDVIAAQVAAELGLPADDSGPRVFAAAVSGLFLSMAEKALAHPDEFDPLVDCALGLRFLSAGFEALKARDRQPVSAPAT